MQNIELNLDDDIIYIDVDGTKVPNISFIWYREEHMLCPFEFIH